MTSRHSTYYVREKTRDGLPYPEPHERPVLEGPFSSAVAAADYARSLGWTDFIVREVQER